MCANYGLADGCAHSCAHCRAHGSPDCCAHGSANVRAHRRTDREPNYRAHGCADNGSDARAYAALRRQCQLLRCIEQLVRTMCR